MVVGPKNKMMKRWVCALVVAAASAEEVHAPEVVRDAELVVRELQALSDSGVYRSLTLHAIRNASRRAGVFHNNTFLALELASPHFASRRAVESFDVIVMHDDDSQTSSFAIDAFPEMAADAIELFQAESIERRKRRRERGLQRLLLESDDDDDDDSPLLRNSAELLEDLRAAAPHSDRWQRARDALNYRDSQLHSHFLVELAGLNTPALRSVAGDEREPLQRRGLAARLLQSRSAAL